MTDDDVRQEIIDTVRRFVAREVVPVASAFERDDRFPTEIVDQMRELGLFGVTIPEAYGGLGLDLLTYVGVIEELAYGWMSLTGVVNTHTMAATLLLEHGDDEQKQRWLPLLASGQRRGALSLSEPDAGSDTRNISCRAQRDGDEYVVNGTKSWVTNGERAGLVALAARTEEGISAFMVEKEPGPHFEGIAVTRHVGKLGYKGVETVEMAYTDHRIPAGNLIGEPGRGLAQILGVLEVGRINIAVPGGRRGPRRLRRRSGLRPGAEHLRQAHRRAPGHPAQAGRHGHPTGGGPTADPERGRTQDGRVAVRRRGRHGQAVRQRDRARAGHRGHAHPRWHRLHHRHPHRALLPGRSPDGHRRGNQRDPEAGHRPRPAGPGPAEGSSAR